MEPPKRNFGINMEKTKIVEVIEFTDPSCPWCYGTEPLLRKLETRFRDQIALSFIMGGLVEDVRNLSEAFDDPTKDVVESNRAVARHWLHTSKEHGMPVNTAAFSLFSYEYPSSYTQGIAFKAVQFQSDSFANEFLRRVRVATALEGLQTTREDVLAELASESGANMVEFFDRIISGDAKKAFESDLTLIDKYHIETLPSWLIRYDGKEVVLHGITTFDALKEAIIGISDGSVKDLLVPKTKDAILDFIFTNIHVAPIEVKTAFELTDEEYNKMIKILKNDDMIEEIKMGNGSLLRFSQLIGTCTDECCCS